MKRKIQKYYITNDSYMATPMEGPCFSLSNIISIKKEDHRLSPGLIKSCNTSYLLGKHLGVKEENDDQKR